MDVLDCQVSQPVHRPTMVIKHPSTIKNRKKHYRIIVILLIQRCLLCIQCKYTGQLDAAFHASCHKKQQEQKKSSVVDIVDIRRRASQLSGITVAPLLVQTHSTIATIHIRLELRSDIARYVQAPTCRQNCLSSLTPGLGALYTCFFWIYGKGK